MAKSLRFTALFFLCALTTLIISLIFAILTLRRYLQALHTPFPNYPCEINNSQIIPCTPRSTHFNLRFTIIPFALSNGLLISPNEQAQLAAYPTAQPSYCPFPSRAHARQFAHHNHLEQGALTQCYTDGVRISLTPAYASHDQLLPDLLRALFPMVVAVLAAVAVVCAVFRLGKSYRMRAHTTASRRSRLGASRLRAHSIHGGMDELGVQTPPRASYGSGMTRKGLSAAEVRRLVQRLKRLRCVDADGICGICLEEFGSRGDVMRLPCRHEFDEMCVVTWFRKGAASCPYCNLRLDEEGASGVETAIEASARDAGGAGVGGWGLGA